MRGDGGRPAAFSVGRDHNLFLSRDALIVHNAKYAGGFPARVERGRIIVPLPSTDARQPRGALRGWAQRLFGANSADSNDVDGVPEAGARILGDVKLVGEEDRLNPVSDRRERFKAVARAGIVEAREGRRR